MVFEKAGDVRRETVPPKTVPSPLRLENGGMALEAEVEEG
jgi:hypothetical protein